MPKKDETPKADKAFTPAEPDEYHGQGGSYIFNPATGQRTRAEEPDNTEE